MAKSFPNRWIDHALIGHKHGSEFDVLGNDEGRSVVLRGTLATWSERTLPPRSTSEKMTCFLRRLTMRTVLGFAADKGFVGFHNFVSPPYRRQRAGLAKRLADAMAKEPGRFVG